MGDVLNGEFEKHCQVRASHLTVQILYGFSPNTYTNRKSKHARRKNLMYLLFFLLVKFLLSQK